MAKSIFKYFHPIILVLFCALFLPVQSSASDVFLTPQEKEFLQAHPVIRVQSSKNWYPFNFIENGECKGLSADLIEIIAKSIGVEIKYIKGPHWADFLEMLDNKDLDVISNIVKTKERSRNILFTQPFLQLVPSIVSSTASPFTSIDQLKGKHVAVIEGHWYQHVIEEKYPSIHLVPVPTNQSALTALVENQIDAAICLDLPVRHLLKTTPFPTLSVTGIIDVNGISSKAIRIGIRDDWPLLASAMNKALISLNNQQRAQLMSKWIGDEGVYNNLLETSSGFTVAEQEYLTTKGTIKVCVDPDWHPVESIDKDGNHVGISAQLLNTIQQRTGIEFDVVPTSTWAASLTKVQQRKCDILSLAMPTPERNEYLEFTSPYIFVPLVIATNQKEVFITDLSMVIDKPLGVVKGYVVKEIILQKYPEAKLVEVDNISHGLQLVEDNKLFGYIDSLATIAYTIQQKGFSNVKVSGQLEETWELSIATRSDEPILRNIMEKAVQTLSQAEKMIEANFWYSVKLEHTVDYSLIWKISGLALVAITIIIAWNRMLYTAGKKTKIALNKLHKTQAELQQAYALMEKIAVTDSLTKIFNRTKLDESLDLEIHRAFRYNTPLSVILIDIDHFKRVNDTYGHQVGDHVLTEIAQILKTRSRQSDTVGRWGGEEFLIICPLTSAEGANAQMQQLRQIIAQHHITPVGIKTASFGATTLQKNDSLESLIARADRALYSAKAEGRNKGVLL